MPRPTSELLTQRESQIMEVLWTHGAVAAETVREALPGDPHDSSVRTMLRVLRNKGYVRIRGRQPALYEPAVARSQVQGKAAKSLLQRFFDGSVEALVMRLVEDEQLTPDQLDGLRKQLSRRKRPGGKR
jgi:predicted transcriptional regulator